MKNGETKTVGNATIRKQTARTSVAQRDSAGTKIGRRCFSQVAYLVSRLDGRLVDVVRSERAALTLAATL